MLVRMGADQATAAPAPMRLSRRLREIRAFRSGPMGSLRIAGCPTSILRKSKEGHASLAVSVLRCRAARLEHAVAGIRPELVIDRGDGKPFQPATFSGMWKDFARKHGFEGITFHGLRHGAATLLLAAGVPDTVAMRAMGQADTRILARYQDVVSELQRDAASRMDRLLGGL